MQSGHAVLFHAPLICVSKCTLHGFKKKQDNGKSPQSLLRGRKQKENKGEGQGTEGRH